jgi:heme exporter protein D
MLDLGRHGEFIWLSYAAVAIVMAALVAWLLVEGRRQSRRLADLEAQGVRRRSATPVAPAEPEPNERA